MDAGVCVLAPNLLVTVTVERGPRRDDELHFHPGGQGYWIARMVRQLGEEPTLCAPVGGEAGIVLEALLKRVGINLAATRTAATSPTHVYDRRSGERSLLARSDAGGIGRHELDDLYGRAIATAIDCGLLVCTGDGGPWGIGEHLYARLGADCAALGIPIVCDLHGPELDALLSGGPVRALKISDDDAIEDGRLGVDPGDAEVDELIDDLRRRGAHDVVVSRSSAPTRAVVDGRHLVASVPELSAADHRGSGDSMTAALAVAIVRELGPEETLRLACGAGAANVTRRGLASGDVSLIAPLAATVSLAEVTPAQEVTPAEGTPAVLPRAGDHAAPCAGLDGREHGTCG